MTKTFCDKCGAEVLARGFAVPVGKKFPDTHSHWRLTVTA